MLQDDLGSRENQRPPGRRGRLAWIISLNIAAVVVAAGAFVGVSHGGHPNAAAPNPPAPSSTVPPGAGSATSAAPTNAAPGSVPPTTAAPAPSDFSPVGASTFPCSDESSLRSTGGGAQVPFSFVNNSQESLQIIWLNYSGSRVTYDILPPGRTYRINTYVGEVWIIADSSASCLGIFSIDGPGNISAA